MPSCWAGKKAILIESEVAYEQVLLNPQLEVWTPTPELEEAVEDATLACGQHGERFFQLLGE